jgi:hypothetical protein
MTRAGPLAIANLLITVRAAVAGQPMAPADIQAAFFNGQPFVAAALAGNKFKMTFTPDGKMTREPLGQSGKPISGTWKLNAKGFCTSWQHAQSIVSLSFQSAKTDGRFKRSQPRSPFQLQPGPNSDVVEGALWSGGTGLIGPRRIAQAPSAAAGRKRTQISLSTDLLTPVGGANHRLATWLVDVRLLAVGVRDDPIILVGPIIIRIGHVAIGSVNLMAKGRICCHRTARPLEDSSPISEVELSATRTVGPRAIKSSKSLGRGRGQSGRSSEQRLPEGRRAAEQDPVERRSGVNRPLDPAEA